MLTDHREGEAGDLGPGTDSERAAQDFIRRHRQQCLWFLREDYVPGDVASLLRAIRQIERHGSRDVYVEARRLREWLSQDSSARSAGS